MKKLFLLQNLEFLSFASNPIYNHMDSNVFQNLSFLKELNLSNISSSYFSSKIFQTLGNLTKLDLSMNPIEEIPQLPPNIRILDISKTNIMNLNGILLPSLVILRASYMNNLTTVFLNDFELLDNLDELDFHGSSKLREINIFSENKHLLPLITHISFKNCDLQYIMPEVWSIVEQAINLELENNPWNCDCKMVWLYDKNLTSDLSSNFR